MIYFRFEFTRSGPASRSQATRSVSTQFVEILWLPYNIRTVVGRHVGRYEIVTRKPFEFMTGARSHLIRKAVIQMSYTNVVHCAFLVQIHSTLVCQSTTTEGYYKSTIVIPSSVLVKRIFQVYFGWPFSQRDCTLRL